jgi:acyl phosphate:glycerol-3-phosphate acyltransferase
MWPQVVFCALAAYLLGSIPFGKIIAKKVARIDITGRGSKNIGATNVAREIGLRWGLLTLLLDALKGLGPILLFAGVVPRTSPAFHLGLSIVAVSALLGHQFSIFERFRGGKGVATALGVFLGISPLACLLALLLFVLVVYRWNFVSLGSILAAASMPPLVAALGQNQEIVMGALIAAVLICLKHLQNIERLLKGEEAKWRGRPPSPGDPKACPTHHRSKNR